MITAETLLGIEDREIRSVDIKNGTAYVRSLSVGEHYAMEAANKTADGDVTKLTANQIAAYVCNESGAPVFNAEQAREFVDKRHPESIRKIIEAAMALNGYGKDSREEMKGNS
jgi:hypothetical protein